MNEELVYTNSLYFSRSLNLCNEIVILDGISGTGKTMFNPIISTFNRMQNARFEYMIEYLCISAQKSKISKDAANSLLNLLADLKLYDGMISREVNFRPSDLSSVFNSSKGKTYLKQLFQQDGEVIENRLRLERPILNLTTHQLLSCLNPAFESYNNRLRVIEIVRHPLYLIDHWSTYIDMFGNNARDFTVWCEYKGQDIPWFAESWAEKYIESPLYDKVIYTIEYLMEDIFRQALSDNRTNQILFIPFEKFVLNPNPYLEKLESHLSSNRSKSTKKILKKQRVPRLKIFDGPQKNIYKRYGVKKEKNTISHKQDYKNRYKSVELKCSSNALKTIDKISNKYEEFFGLWF